MGLYLRKNSKYWWITYSVNGKQHHESSQSTRKGHAVRLLQIRKADTVRGLIPVLRSQSPHLSDSLDSYIQTIQNSKTRLRYECSKKVLVEYFGNIRLCDVSPEQIEAFISRRRRQGVTAGGINRELALLRADLNRAVLRDKLTVSPFRTISFLNEEKERKPPKVLTLLEEARILSVCETYLRTLVILLVETGLRVGIEALPLKWEDINFVTQTIAVRNSKTVYGVRSLPLSDYCSAELRHWQKLTLYSSPYVFFNPQNPSVPLQSVKKSWATAVKLAGLKHFPIYNCRHTFATRLLAAGVSDGIVSQMLGHSRRDVLRFYSGIVSENWRAAIRKLEELREQHLLSIGVRAIIPMAELKAVIQ